MAKVYCEGVQIYPVTTPDDVIDINTGKNITEIMDEQKNFILSMMKGIGEDVDAKEYPFKNLGTVSNSTELNNLLDSLHGKSSNNACGWFRVDVNGIYMQIYNFATSYENDMYAQALIGPFGINSNTGKVEIGSTLCMARRKHVGGNSPYWTEWENMQSQSGTIIIN